MSRGKVHGYALVVGKNGPKLKNASEADSIAAEQSPSRSRVSGLGKDGYPLLSGPGMIYPYLSGSNGKVIHLIARAQTPGDLARILTGLIHGPIVDDNSLAGRYDFTLDFAVEPGAEAPPRRS
jgi:uncharacterized protein (TIGR03435 family)